MLPKLGVINRLYIDDKGRLQQHIDARPEVDFGTVPAKINGVWFNAVRLAGFEGGMNELDKSVRDAWKNAIAKASWTGKAINIKALGERLLAYNEHDELIGFIDKSNKVPAGRYSILSAQADDGNLAVYLQVA